MTISSEITYDKVGNIAGQSLNMISVIRSALKKAHGGKASYSDLIVMISIIEGNKTRKQVQEDTGLDKVSACQALARLRGSGIISPSREPKPGAHSPAPVYSLADPSIVLRVATKLEAAR